MQMDEEKVFIWVLEIPKQPAPEKILFSATGTDREDAEGKILAYIRALPPTPELTTELFSQWVRSVDPITPEVREGVWLLHVTSNITVLSH